MCWQLASVSCEIRQSRENRFQPQGCSVPKQGTNTQKNPWAPRQKIMRSYRIVSMGSWGILLCSHNLFSGCIPLLCFVHRGYTIWEVPQKLSYKQFTVGTQYGKYHKNCLINKRAPHPQLMPQQPRSYSVWEPLNQVSRSPIFHVLPAGYHRHFGCLYD